MFLLELNLRILRSHFSRGKHRITRCPIISGVLHGRIARSNEKFWSVGFTWWRVSWKSMASKQFYISLKVIYFDVFHLMVTLNFGSNLYTCYSWINEAGHEFSLQVLLHTPCPTMIMQWMHKFTKVYKMDLGVTFFFFSFSVLAYLIYIRILHVQVWLLLMIKTGSHQ